jgi:hypothetical protein
MITSYLVWQSLEQHGTGHGPRTIPFAVSNPTRGNLGIKPSSTYRFIGHNLLIDVITHCLHPDTVGLTWNSTNLALALGGSLGSASASLSHPFSAWAAAGHSALLARLEARVRHAGGA